ncbi:MAG: DegQ family serine endoprotease [Alphaproteobacteria bacterium]
MRTKPNLYLLAFILISFLSLPAVGFAQTDGQQASAPNHAPASFADLVEGLTPAVVNISSTPKASDARDFPDMPQFPEGSPFEDFFEEFMERRGRGMETIPQASLGSGFIIDAKQGYIVTNNHVIRDADEVKITLYNDETIDGEVIGVDEKTDIAVLKVDPEEYELSDVSFGRSDGLRVGDWVVAIGNPFGLGGTVTAGIISARQRDINSGPYDDYLQTDASINRGNSGGPMFNLKGEVIGINTAIFSPTGGSVGIGFAIPSNLAKPVIDQIIKYGRTRRGWLGVRIQTVTDEIAESLDLPNTSGALVASITPEGPAEEAGLQHGDVILEFNGQEVEDMRSLPRIVAETPIGEAVDLHYWREGERKTTSVSIGELEKAEEEGLLDTTPTSKGSLTEVAPLALGVKPLTDTARAEYSVPATVDGVLIGEVEEASEAEQKGLMEGDVIVEINQQPVRAPEDVNDIVNAAVNAGRSSVLLLINREGDVRFVALRLD